MANGFAGRSPTSPEDRTFHPVPLLPIELRLKIYSHTSLPRRMIKISSDDILPLTLGSFGKQRAQHCQRGERSYIIHHRVKISAVVPAILQVCREFREAHIRQYPLLLSAPTGNRPVRVNFELDSFFFEYRDAHLSFMRTYQENLKYSSEEWSLVRSSLRRVVYGDDLWTFKLPFHNLLSVIAKDWRDHQALTWGQQLIRENRAQTLVEQNGRDASLPKLEIHPLLRPEFEKMIRDSQPSVRTLAPFSFRRNSS